MVTLVTDRTVLGLLWLFHARGLPPIARTPGPIVVATLMLPLLILECYVDYKSEDRSSYKLILSSIQASFVVSQQLGTLLPSALLQEQNTLAVRLQWHWFIAQDHTLYINGMWS